MWHLVALISTNKYMVSYGNFDVVDFYFIIFFANVLNNNEQYNILMYVVLYFQGYIRWRNKKYYLA